MTTNRKDYMVSYMRGYMRNKKVYYLNDITDACMEKIQYHWLRRAEKEGIVGKITKNLILNHIVQDYMKKSVPNGTEFLYNKLKEKEDAKSRDQDS
jgi:hypothetical protein